MTLPATHRLDSHHVHAWQYLPGRPVPEWIKATFRDYGLGKLANVSRCGVLVELHEFDWAVNTGQSCVVLSNEEIGKVFLKL